MAKIKKKWCLYMLDCNNGSLYTGISPDPQKRFQAHQKGRGAAYTRMHPPRAMLLCEEVGTYSQALKLEWKVKRMSRKRKLGLVKDPKGLKQVKRRS